MSKALLVHATVKGFVPHWLDMSPGKKDLGEENEAVANFREYLRIPSVQPDVNYGM